MKLPIVAYGDPVLRKVCVDIAQDHPDLSKLISDMFDTMYAASGVGLAAPQIGQAIRLFIVDTGDHEEGEKGFKRVFINATILEETGEPWAFTEGCLSIPEIREDVLRKPNILIRYYDENWALHEEEFTSMPARVIQHEYDHIQGKLFTDTLSLLRKRMLKSKLDAISRGDVRADYRMKFPQQRNRKR